MQIVNAFNVASTILLMVVGFFIAFLGTTKEETSIETYSSQEEINTMFSGKKALLKFIIITLTINIYFTQMGPHF